MLVIRLVIQPITQMPENNKMERIKLNIEDLHLNSEALLTAINSQIEDGLNNILDSFCSVAFFTIEENNPGEIRFYLGDDCEKYANNNLSFLEMQLLDRGIETREAWAAEFERIAKSLRQKR